MNTMHKTLAALAAITLSATAVAQELNQFEAGQPAVAADVNENFQLLEARIEALEQASIIDEESLSGVYRFHGMGSRYEFFDTQESTELHHEFAQREFLFVGDLVLNADGTGEFDVSDDMEMQVFLHNWSPMEFRDESVFEFDQPAGGPAATWNYNAAENVIDLTLDLGEDGLLPVELHVSRDQNALLGVVFMTEHEYYAEYDEWKRDYEMIEFTGVRMPD